MPGAGFSPAAVPSNRHGRRIPGEPHRSIYAGLGGNACEYLQLISGDEIAGAPDVEGGFRSGKMPVAFLMNKDSFDDGQNTPGLNLVWEGNWCEYTSLGFQARAKPCSLQVIRSLALSAQVGNAGSQWGNLGALCDIHYAERCISCA